ncbi:MAG: hypothetical protein WAN35_00040 [Terracidiphilus sp.]
MRFFVSALVFLSCSLTLAAQSTPKIEIFGGFSYLNYEAASDNLPSGTETDTYDTSCTSTLCSSSSFTETGPSYVKFNPRMGLYGWDGSVTAILTPWFGLTTEMSGNYNTSTRSATTTVTVIQNNTCSSNSSNFCTPSTNTSVNTYQVTVSEPLLHHFLFGPQFYFPTRKMRTYAHFLIGGVNRNASSLESFNESSSDNSITIGNALAAPSSFNEFAIGFGGGIDYPLRKKLSWRTGADYLTSAGTAQNHFRVSTGLVWRIGK